MEVNLNQNEEYKETELGLLPKEWGVVKLKDVVTTKKGRKPKTLSEDIKKDYLPYLTAEYFRTKRAKQFASTKNESLITVDKEDVVFIWDGSNAGDVFTGLNGVLASTMIKISPKKESSLTRKILYYYLKTKFYQFNTQTTGSTIPHVNKNMFENLLIPLPPLSEQKRITFVLSTIQEAKEKTEDVIKALKELKKSMMKHLFTYGPVPVEEAEHVPLKETEIGLVPEEWEVVRLGDVVEIHDKERVPLNSAERSKMIGLYPYCGANGIIDYVNNYIFDGEFVLLAEDGGFWRKFENTAYLMEGKFWVNNHAHIIRAIENRSINRFLLYWFIFDNIEKYTSGTTRKKLNQNVMKKILIPLPPLSVQQKITSILSAIDQKIEAEENKKKALEDLFQSMLHHLMTAKVRVNHLEVEA